MFFVDQRSQFFNPLTGKYREIVAECLRLLYRHLYTDIRDYGNALNRDQLIDIFKEAIARTPLLDEGDAAADSEGRFKSHRELAGFIVNRLIETGWLEKQVDDATLQSTYGFSRVGRIFTSPFADGDSNRFRTRNRNTRNTRNSLQAFYDQGEVHDLLDAYEYSERIISDFTDVISDLEERKRQLVREVEARQLIQHATDEFFDFMDKVFKPDLEVRLSADSVEKYRDQIADIIRKIRTKRKYGKGNEASAARDWRAVMETDLRKLLPHRVVAGVSLLDTLLSGIEARLRNACDVMLPALRRALNTFTQRADIIIRQLSYIHAQGDNVLVDVCRDLSQLADAEQDAILADYTDTLSGVHLGYLDPSQIQLRNGWQKTVVRSNLEHEQPLDRDAQKTLVIQQALDQAFIVQGSAVREYILSALRDTSRINSRDLNATTVTELLSLAHAIEAGSVNNLSSEFQFVIEQHPDWLLGAPRIQHNDFFVSRDEFVITMVDTTHG